MPTVYYGEDSTPSEERRTRGVLTYSVNETDTELTITTKSQLQCRYYWHAGYRLNTIVDGNVVTTNVGYEPEIYYDFTTFLSTAEYTTAPYVKTHIDQTVVIGSSYYGESASGWDPGPMNGDCSVTITIPAKTSYSVTYNANGGSGAPTGQIKWYNEDLQLKVEAPERLGYTFLGWGTSRNSTAVAYRIGSIYKVNANITLYAIWDFGDYTPVKKRSNIRLFESTDTEFNTNGLGSLSDATKCVVKEERNGEFELEMDYPITGINYDLLDFRRIIVAKPNPYDDYQPFRIYSISKPISGIVTVNACHISYDLSGYSVSPFAATSASDALISKIPANMVLPSGGSCPFTFWTDIGTSSDMVITKPSSVRSVLGGTEGSVLDIFNGEYEFDGFNVKLHANRGDDYGVSIRYGKNLTDLKQEENCNNVYTDVYPYWYSEEDGLIELTNKLVHAEGEYNYVRVLTLDMSEYFEEAPTEAQLNEATVKYIQTHNIGVPEISLTVSFINLSDSEEYKAYALLEAIRLCDIVHVDFPKLKVSATAKCIETKYNVLTGKYSSVELGDSKSNLATTISNQNIIVKDTVSRTNLEKAIITATNLITGQRGGYVVLNPPNNPSEILILDEPTIQSAVKVWKWSQGGLGYSSNGYNGPYSTAITMNGQIVADFITTGTLNANLIQTGIITGANSGFTLDVDTGHFNFGDSGLKYDGNTLDIVANSITLAGQRVTTSDDLNDARESAISESKSYVDSEMADVKSFQNIYTGYITIKPNESTIILGKTDSNSNVTISNEQMVLTGSDSTVATVGNSKFSVQNIEATSIVLQKADETGNKFVWEMRDNGHISLKKVK